LAVVRELTCGERLMATAIKKLEISVGLDQLRRRFEQYRQTRKARTRIPDNLWNAAAKMAGRFGVHRTADVLRLNYYDLKKRVEDGNATASASAVGKRSPQKTPTYTPKPRTASAANLKAARFIELLAPAGNCDHPGHGGPTPSVQAFLPAGCCDCTVELEDADGAKMRICIQGAETPDLAELGRSFWSRRP
jgi:hypothetical protein